MGKDKYVYIYIHGKTNAPGQIYLQLHVFIWMYMAYVYHLFTSFLDASTCAIKRWDDEGTPRGLMSNPCQ